MQRKVVGAMTFSLEVTLLTFYVHDWAGTYLGFYTAFYGVCIILLMDHGA